MKKITFNTPFELNKFLFLLICAFGMFVFVPKAFAHHVKDLSGKAATASLKKAKEPIYLNTNYSFRERAADLVSQMTLAEEVKQLRTNFAPAIPRLGVHQYYYWSEGQHGINAMFGNLHDGQPGPKRGYNYGRPHATSFPTNFASTMSWDPKLIYEETTAISSEARGFLDKSLFGKGKNNLGESIDDYGNLTYWAPTINMDRDPRWGRNDEAFGEDPYLASRMAAAFVDGFQGQTMNGKPMTKYLKVAATAKHFTMNDVENNRTGITSNASNEAIRDYYTAVFRYLVEKAHVAGIMTSYNAVNGTPAVANSFLVNTLLQRTFGFHGYTTSDCGAVGTTYRLFPRGHNWAPPGWKITRKDDESIWLNKTTGIKVPAAAGGQAFAVRVGTQLNCTGYEYTLSNIEAAIKAGVLSKGVIDRALTRVFTIRMRTGEFDPRNMVPYNKITKAVIQSPAHQRLAEKVAENSLVLLKNDPLPGSGKTLLPIDASKIHKIVIVGNLANKVTLGGYSGNPSLKVDAVQGITTAMKVANPKASVIFDKTGTSTTAELPAKLDAKTKADIRSADLVVVFVGTDMAISHEGHDRASLAMPGNYTSLIYQVAELGNPNMVMVIQSNGPIKINYVKHMFPAIVFSGYNGESQGTALAHVLLGMKNPSGHLNFTWYKDNTQLPNKTNYYLTPRKTNGLGRTYMYFTKKPTYPFGFGLSYTKFKISNAKLSTHSVSPNGSVTMSFDVTNTGNVAGATVAQLYVGFPKIKGETLPIKKLEGFQKTETLKPGQTQHIAINVKISQLAMWNEEAFKSMVYNGNYQFEIGYNSSDIAASKNVEIRGQLTPKVKYVTVELPKLIYHVGETFNLNGKNKWIKSDINTALAQPHPIADNIVEAVLNNSSFLNLKNAKVQYSSNNDSVVKVSRDGKVKAVGPGVTTINVTVNGVSGSTVIVVKRN